MCGQLPFVADRLFGAVDLALCVAERLLCVAAFPCVAATAAPLPPVSASTAKTARSVRLGLRIDTSFCP
jgi:hypothetical protein